MTSASPARWGELRLFGVVRLVIALSLVMLGMVALEPDDARFVQIASIGVLGAVLALIAASVWQRQFVLQLATATLIDLLVLTSLVYSSSGLRGGLSVLCVATVAGAAVLAPPLMARFFAAACSLMLIIGALQQVLLTDAAEIQAVFQAGLVGIACFAVAELINRLAIRSAQQQALAERRGRELRDQLTFTQQALAEVPQAVMVVDPEGKLELSNRAARILLQLETEVAGSLGDSAAGRVVQESIRVWGDTTSTLDSRPVLELPGPDNATPVPVRIRVHTTNTESRARIVVLEDLRLVQQQAEQLKLASMGRLSAGIAHEIRNPLAAIRHANGLLQESLHPGQTPEIQLRLGRIVETNAVRIDRIVEDVLSLARQQPLQGQRADGQAVLEEVLAEIGLQQPEQLARLNLRQGPPQWVAFSADHLRQVVVNLINNALRYASPQQGAIQLGLMTTPDPQCLELCVADNGPGLTEQAKQHLFEPFFTTSPSGTGLGLSLARQICELNGARLEYRERSLIFAGYHEFVVTIVRVAS